MLDNTINLPPPRIRIQVAFVCPVTGLNVSTDSGYMHMEHLDGAGDWSAENSLYIHCPECGKNHEVDVG